MSRHALSLFALAFALSPMAALADAAGEVMVDAPFVRAVPPMQPNSAAFMVLHNHSGNAHAVVSASSPAAEVVELHTHTMADGMMQMRRIEQIALPAGEMVSLQPGGLHVMLIGLTGPLQVDQVVSLTLTFEDGSSTSVEAPVKSVSSPMMPMAGEGSMDHSGMDHGHMGH